MPELPFVTVLVENLWPRVESRAITDVLVRGVAALKTFDPPIAALVGCRITGIRRRGKLLVFSLSGGPAMVMHLMRNGRLQLSPRAKGRTAKDLAIAFGFDDGSDLRMIEIGPKKAAAVWLFPAGREAAGEPLVSLGMEPLSSQFTPEVLAGMLREARTQLKRFLTLQRYVVGIGNTFSDEILWAARLSPQTLTTALTGDEVARLHTAITRTLAEAVTAHRTEFAGALPMREPLHLLRVHRHGKEPCPRCGTPVAVIYYEDRETYYCPTCQTGGKIYADRRRSRLLK
ncbi:MAG TPA: DNA-formamidopyrimidine glycosylase family protein [bacterium]|nr:DNA-formamidopyrimidine glycosylase family protein [bacterium]